MRKISLLLSLILLFTGCAGLNARNDASSVYTRPGPLAVKSLYIDNLKDAARRNRPLPMRIDYPTDNLAYPLVILSHGAAGNCDSYAVQSEHLASHGYIVISTEHPVSNSAYFKWCRSQENGRLGLTDILQRMTNNPWAVLERPKDISFAIDQALVWNQSHPILKGRIITDKIAVMGHSFGAYTTMAVCGARPTLEHLTPKVGDGRGLSGDLSDPRVTFGLAMSPQSPGSSFFNEESYAFINKPLICLTGSADKQKKHDGTTMNPEVRKQVFELLPPGEKIFLWLKNADHLSFAENHASRWLPSPSRKDVQRITQAMMVIACDHYLKADPEAAQYLTEDYFNTLKGRVVNEIEWHSK